MRKVQMRLGTGISRHAGGFLFSLYETHLKRTRAKLQLKFFYKHFIYLVYPAQLRIIWKVIGI